MKPYLLTRKSLNPSARIISRALDIEKSYEPRPYAPVIRWGNSDSGPFTDSTINSSEFIYTVANKLRFSRKMTELAIPHVEILNGVPDSFPVVVRHNLSASRGKGIEIVETPSQYSAEEWEGLYWSYWRNFPIELGVHFFSGKILRLFKKVNPEEDSEDKFPIKNASLGWRFSLVDLEKYPKLLPVMEKFMECFPHSFGRVDIGWNSAKKTYEIIEVNSAPGISENQNTAEIYISAFKEYLWQ